MSVIFNAEGYIIYPSRRVLEEMIAHLQDTNQMNDNRVWLDGSNNAFSPNKQQVYPESNCLMLPRARNYRNLSTGKLLEDAEWARLITYAGPSEETVVQNENHDVIHRINMEDWFRENVVDEQPHLGWTWDYLDEVWDSINIDPPAELKERMRLKNASRHADVLLHELTKTPLECLHPDQKPLARFESRRD